MKIKKHILVVDDEAVTRFGVMLAVKKAGYYASEASCACQARHMILSALEKKSPFDLLLLDINMPDITGTALFDELTRLKICPPTIFVTGSFEQLGPDILENEYCRGFMIKPFVNNELVDSITETLAVDLQKLSNKGFCQTK